MHNVRVTFEDGNTIETRINGTKEEVRKYYIGNYFNFGDCERIPVDKMVKATKVEFL